MTRFQSFHAGSPSPWFRTWMWGIINRREDERMYWRSWDGWSENVDPVPMCNRGDSRTVSTCANPNGKYHIGLHPMSLEWTRMVSALSGMYSCRSAFCVATAVCMGPLLFVTIVLRLICPTHTICSVDCELFREWEGKKPLNKALFQICNVMNRSSTYDPTVYKQWVLPDVRRKSFTRKPAQSWTDHAPTWQALTSHLNLALRWCGQASLSKCHLVEK